ncbi:hypothetical protein CBR_g21147 [Chara braunii]|uniref:Endonuclease/exonuclease/phosphatase domain-containing protein n=1 Tax=Chara braunii TaxID=69332 RepID=A0A388L0T2_CHABU|nr:hypothetical protein CBR_g21147 [Chara braunii]|eukprot:GBG75905.1 hypothetical protein CBR_g21147 [Chara braunii]
MPNLKITTWNVRGLGDSTPKHKKARLKTWLHKHKIQVCFLQETKLDEGKLQQLAGWWRGPQTWAPADGTRGGSTILIHRDLEAEILEHDANIWEHWAWVRIQLGAEDWVLMTVYVPSEPAERRSFLEKLPAIIPSAQNLILAGDFNVVLTPGLDSPGPEVAPRKADAVTLSNLMEQQQLVDTFRTTHPLEAGYTWFSSQQTGDRLPPKRSLDLLLAKGAAWEALTTVECYIEYLSDHRPLVAAFKLADDLIRGTGTFRLNTELLNTPEVLQWVEAHWRDWQQTKDWFTTEEEWMQVGFRMVTRALDVFSRVQARARRQQEQECRWKVEEAEVELELNPLAELYWQRRRNQALQQLEELQIQQQILWAKRAQERGMQTGDRMTKETFQRLCPPRSHALMRELQHPFHLEAPVAKDSEAMGDYALTYFNDILTSRRQPDQTLQELMVEHNLWQHTRVGISQECRDNLDQPITLEELWEAVKSMARGKSPGSEGLPVEFYEALWPHIGPILLRLYNRTKEGGRLTEDMKLGL